MNMTEIKSLNIDLKQGDCLELMKDIPDESIDMILCDLPYDCGKTRAKWDKEIDIIQLIEQYKRVIKPNGAIVLFGNEPYSSKLRLAMQDLYKYDYKWVKNVKTGFANANYRPMNNYEDIMVFSFANASSGGKTNPMIYNPQGLKEVNIIKKNRSNRHGLVMADTNNTGKNNSLLQEGSSYTQKFTNYPINVLHFNIDNNRVHPTQKPVVLLEYLIKTYTNDGGTVLDNCMGSGSTGVACARTNRNFIGIELDENYFNIAKSRIGKETEDEDNNK